MEAVNIIMKTIEINNKEYILPTSWSECTLKQAIKIQDIENQEDEYKALILLSGYGDIELKELMKMNINDVHKIADIMKFILEPISEDPISEFEFKGNKYIVIESFLNAQAQDYFTTEAILTNYKHNVYKALPELIAVMCKKEEESLDDFDLKERAKLFEELPMNICNSLRLFFCGLGMMSEIASQSFSNRREIIQSKVNEVRNTVQKLAGTGYYFKWLAKMSLKYINYLEKNWLIYSSGIPSNSIESSTKTIFKK